MVKAILLHFIFELIIKYIKSCLKLCPCEILSLGGMSSNKYSIVIGRPKKGEVGAVKAFINVNPGTCKLPLVFYDRSLEFDVDCAEIIVFCGGESQKIHQWGGSEKFPCLQGQGSRFSRPIFQSNFMNTKTNLCMCGTF